MRDKTFQVEGTERRVSGWNTGWRGRLGQVIQDQDEEFGYFLSAMCFKQRCDLTYVSKMSLHGTKQEGVPGGRGVTRGG